MKKRICLFLSLTVLLLFSSCSKNPEPDHSDETSQVSSQEASPVPEESSDPMKGAILPSVLGFLQDGSSYYLKAEMKVEKTGKPDQSKQYQLLIAVDLQKNTAMVFAEMPDETIHVLVKNKMSYRIHDEEKSYSVQRFTGGLASLAKSYTSDLYLGVTTGLSLIESGKASITLTDGSAPVSADYEKFEMLNTVSSTDALYFTYYYIQQKPVMEIMETSSGKTTYIFREISDTIKDTSVFSLPSDYTVKDD